MKKILLIFTLLICLVSSGQVFQPYSQYGGQWKGHAATRVSFFPTGCGDPTTMATKDSVLNMAASYFDSCNHKYWLYDPKLKAWDTLASGSGSIDSLIYSTRAWRQKGDDSLGAVIAGIGRTGNLLYVDAVYGNNSTAQLNNLAKPYLTLAAAKAAATTGYTIIVRPGVYDGNDLLKDSVNWYFMPGAIVNVQPVYGSALFDCSIDLTCNVYGYGKFIDTLGGFSRIVAINSNSNIYIECQSMEVGNGDADIAIEITSGNLKVLAREYIESKNYDAVIVTGGNLILEADIIRAIGADEGNAIELQGGTSTIKCRTYTSSATYDAFGSGAAIFMSGGNSIITGDGVSDLSDGIFIQNTSTSGYLNLTGSIKSSSKTAVFYKTGATNKTISFQGRIISNTSYDSIDAGDAQTIVSYGAFANRAYDANITVNGVLTIGSYVQ